MGIATYVSKVSFGNQLLLPRALYPEISVPEGVAAYDAIPKTPAEMISISIERRNLYGYRTEANLMSMPAGYTRSDLAVRFVNFSAQWQQNGSNWTYRGGRIELELSLSIYADQRAANKPSCWALILEHELRHVGDEIDIVKNYLPRALNQSSIIRGFLQLPVPDSEFNTTIRGQGTGAGSLFEQRIQQSIWIPESSNRASRLHQQRPGDGVAIRDCINAP